MSILNKAILTGGLVMGVAFSAMAHPELKSSVPQADSAVAAPEKIQLNGNDSNLLIVFYVQIMPDDFVMQLHRF